VSQLPKPYSDDAAAVYKHLRVLRGRLLVIPALGPQAPAGGAPVGQALDLMTLDRAPPWNPRLAR